MKKLNSSVIMIVCLCIALSFGLPAGNAADLKIGVLAIRGNEICMKKWSPTAKYLSDKITGATFKILPLDFNTVVSSVEKDKCDFILTNPAFYVELESRFGINRIATLKNLRLGHAYTKFGGVVFSRANEKNIKNFKDLKDKIYAAPDPRAFGAWIAVRRELKNAGINPYNDFKNIKFTGTMDSVVYAVKNGKAHAGSVRTDTLERMDMEGKINIKNFYILNAKKYTKDFPFAHSTDLYPEWPMAVIKHVSPGFAEQVAEALMDMPENSPAARAAKCAGWTIPSNYQDVHKCLKELKLGPYKCLGNVSLYDSLMGHWYFFLAVLAIIIFLTGALIVFLFLNKKVKLSNAKLILEIKDRKRTENELLESREKLKKSEAMLKNVFQASPFGISLVKNRRILWHNDNMTRMLGYSSDEIYGTNARILYSCDEEYERVGKTISAICSEKRTSEIETKWVRKDGSDFNCHIRYALLDPEKKDSTIIAIAEDITKRKKAEQEKKKLREQFNQAQKMETIGLLAGGVAHDFNNILTIIIGNADLIMMDLDKNTHFYKYVEEIHESGQRAAVLTRQLLAFSRKEIIQPEIMNLNQTVTNLGKMLRRLIGEDIDLIIECESGLLQIKADPGQMEQIIMNLAVNARDAMPHGGKLTIETLNVDLDEQYFRDHAVEAATGKYVMLAITDNGMGMDKKIQSRIFEPFFTTKEMGRGTGLGLSTVYGIVKQNKGHIWVYSEINKGTTFKIYLPAFETEIKEKPEKRSYDHLARGSETILIAEDDDILRDMAKKILELAGYRVITARTGKEAIKTVKDYDGSINLLLTDIVMPGMNGQELGEHIQQEIPDIKILYTSGYTANTIAHRGVLDKDINFIQKPFTHETLTRKIREIIDKDLK